MEHEDWTPVIERAFRDHMTDMEAVAKALAITDHGDDVEWKGFRSKAAIFLDAMKKSRPKILQLEQV